MTSPETPAPPDYLAQEAEARVQLDEATQTYVGEFIKPKPNYRARLELWNAYCDRRDAYRDAIERRVRAEVLVCVKCGIAEDDHFCLVQPIAHVEANCPSLHQFGRAEMEEGGDG